MGKSNKFDYTNRPNSGAKLGQIIGASLQKEAEKVKKDAERHLRKARKQSTDSSSGNLDSAPTIQVIDLKAPNKDLTDDGVCALVDGLELGLKSGTSEASLALEDLKLSGNKITTQCLARLAPVIQLAKNDLKTLNLANNSIRVESDGEAAQWEAFLLAFRDCIKLRRLDLSGNQQLGCRAIEIFARVYVTETAISPIPPGSATSTISPVSEHQDIKHELSSAQAESLQGLGVSSSPAMNNRRVITRRCGLRSVPYITLHDIGLDDAGALWLSYILENHLYPNLLIDDMNSAHSETSMKPFQEDADLQGLEWSNNIALGKDGLQLLEKTENIRRIMLDDRATSTNPVAEDTDSVLGDGESGRRKSLDRGQLRVRDGARRSSLKSIRTSGGGEHDTSELESARKKLMRCVIAHEGASSVELWHAALTIFRASRILLYISPITRKLYTGPALFNVQSEHDTTLAKASDTSGSLGLQDEASKPVLNISTIQPSYASKLSSGSNGTGEPESAVTVVTNTPVTPMILQRPTHRKGGFSEDHAYFHTVSGKLNGLVIQDQGPEPYIRYQQRRLETMVNEARPFRDPRVPCHLPSHIMEYILTFMMTAREISVMSGGQRTAALERGQRRETLTNEMEWRKKDESAQILMLLDSISSLAYEQ